MSIVDRRRFGQMLCAAGVASLGLATDVNRNHQQESNKLSRDVAISVGTEQVRFLTSRLRREGNFWYLGTGWLDDRSLYRLDGSNTLQGPFLDAVFMTTIPELVSVGVRSISLNITQAEEDLSSFQRYDGRLSVFSRVEGSNKTLKDVYLLQPSAIKTYKFVRDIESGRPYLKASHVVPVFEGSVGPRIQDLMFPLDDRFGGGFAVLAETGSLYAKRS